MIRLKKTLGQGAAWVFAVVSLFAARPAFAQGTAVLTGTVLDAATKRPAADVVVYATSPALQGEQVVVTDGGGNYRIPQLPPGDYTIRLEKETYKPYSRGGITLRVNSTIRVNVELLPEALKEEIVVVGKAPTVDVGSTNTGVTVGQEFVNRIALNPPSGKGAATRSFESLATVAPGTYSDTYGVSVSGTTSPENAFVIDGLSVNDPAYGVLGTPLSVEFVREVNIVTGGYMPEYGRATGGIFDVVTKSGSNEFHGSVFSSITPGAFEGPREIVKRAGQTISTDPKLSSLRDFGFEVGGPIMKDKLWFFAGFNVSFQQYSLERNLNRLRYKMNPDGTVQLTDPAHGDYTPVKDLDDAGFQLTDRIPGTQKFYYATGQTIQYIGKLTYLINQDHNLTLSIYGSPSSSGGNGTFPIDGQTGGLIGNITGPYEALATKDEATVNDISLKSQSSFLNKNLLIDATLGWHHAAYTSLPSDGSEIASGKGLAATPAVAYRRSRNPGFHPITDFESLPAGQQGACNPLTNPNGPLDDDGNPTTVSVNPCTVTGYRRGGPGYIDQAKLDRWAGKAVGTYILNALGSHTIKAGVDVEILSYDHLKAYTGDIFYRESVTGSNFADYRRYGFLQGPDNVVPLKSYEASSTSTTLGGFVQDSWNILDRVTLNAGVRYDIQMINGDDGKLGMTLPNQWSPRVGVLYDFTRQGRSKIYANFARFYESVPLDIGDRSFPGERQIISYRGSDVCPDPADTSNAACDAQENKWPVGWTTDPNVFWIPTGGEKVPVDPDLKPQSSDEIVVGGEYEVFSDARVGLLYKHRYMNYVIEDMSRDEANTYFIGNPGYGAASDFPKAKRDYDELTVFFQKAFASQWLAQASYTLAYLRGNYAGLFRPETAQLDPNINSDFDLISLLPNRDGPLPGDRTHSFKLYGAKEFTLPADFTVNLGLTYQGRSGTPLNVLGSHPLYGGNEVFILPRGSGGRMPWVHTIDSNLTVGYRLGKSSQLTIGLDIFNLFNFQAETARDQTFTSADVRPILNGKDSDLPAEDAQACDGTTPCSYKLVYFEDGSPFDPADRNPNYGNPVQYQAPRQFRISAKVTF